MSPADLKYLRTFGSERYNDFSKDFDALPAFNRLAHAGYCRVIWDGPAWRVAQSDEQKKMTMRALDAAL
jgi:hypothetical protein